MKSLRSRLFLHAGSVLLIVAAICFFLPDYFLRKDLDKASAKINTFVQVRTPEERARLTVFFKQLRQALSQEISTALLATVLLSLAVALLLLNRMAKKISRPIKLLALASEEVSKGKLEDLNLPHIEQREDEIGMLANSFENMVQGLRDKEKIRGVLNKVVSKEIAGQLLKSNIELGGEERIVTVLFSDIRGFTHLSEGLDPKVLIKLLNDYMTRMCKIIEEHGGVIDKFVGDAIMALYGAPLPLEDHASKAVESSLRMLQELKEYNAGLMREGKIAFECGIGIHTGLVFSGNMGAADRLNYTVVGSNVNLASRLCSVASRMQIIVSEETRKRCDGKFNFKELPPISLKGIDVPITPYEVIN